MLLTTAKPAHANANITAAEMGPWLSISEDSKCAETLHLERSVRGAGCGVACHAQASVAMSCSDGTVLGKIAVITNAAAFEKVYPASKTG